MTIKFMRYSIWRKLLVEPKSKDNDWRRREFILNVLLVNSTILAALALIIVLVRFFELGSAYSGQPPMLAILEVVVLAGLLVLSRKGFFVPAAYTLVIIFLLLALYMLFSLGILAPHGVLLLALVLVMSSILLGTRAGAILTLVSSAMLILMGVLQQSGKLAVANTSWMETPGGLTDAVGFSLILAVITTVSWLSNREIERFNITLKDEVRRATEHLSLANKKLKVLDKTKDEFISMASHQLGTPLTAVTGYLSMALDEDKGNLSVAQREYITIALESSERLVSMAGDLLNVSRLNAGRFHIVRQPVDLVPLIQQELQQLHPAAERKNLLLEFTPPATPLPPVAIDESKTRQVVMNFIDNAIYYTEKGSIRVTLEEVGNHAVFKVIDTGMGVPPAEQARLFAKFYRAENAKSVRPDGTGLGLFLAKRVIEDQDGEIIFKSTMGVGSTFGFKLPLAVEPSQKTHA